MNPTFYSSKDSKIIPCQRLSQAPSGDALRCQVQKDAKVSWKEKFVMSWKLYAKYEFSFIAKIVLLVNDDMMKPGTVDFRQNAGIHPSLMAAGCARKASPLKYHPSWLIWEWMMWLGGSWVYSAQDTHAFQDCQSASPSCH